MTDLADAAAELLPGPPTDGDITGYLQWRELVWDTALRLGRLGAARDQAPADDDSWTNRPDGAPVTGPELLELAAQLRGLAEPRVAPRPPTTFTAIVKRSPGDRTAPRPR